ncbi:MULTISPECIES: hypothetical protein [Moorena]|uniref:Uncharacterized protein n=1 Tax=Moorena producens (strain JHB) TaxID=1454205 RepID=A0A9Q9ST89_MOOP1|nr:MULTISPECIES: hypothetical protein [Moorena]NEQ07924.1 hypothetical protein [Moorena sp. SIO4E2]NES45159.1 hypothetical protein [Moorena sp. SIO2C4]NET65821.1 hypothetical protein [Moorena sp. SIO1G6]WAN69239.1 hypothetical protein BJP36_43550 [Moorena producens JHB]
MVGSHNPMVGSAEQPYYKLRNLSDTLPTLHELLVNHLLPTPYSLFPIPYSLFPLL